MYGKIMREEWMQNIACWLHVRLCVCVKYLHGGLGHFETQKMLHHCTDCANMDWLLGGTLTSLVRQYFQILSILIMVPTAAMTVGKCSSCMLSLSGKRALHHQHMISYDVHLYPLHIHPKCHGLWSVSVTVITYWKNVCLHPLHITGPACGVGDVCQGCLYSLLTEWQRNHQSNLQQFNVRHRNNIIIPYIPSFNFQAFRPSA